MSASHTEKALEAVVEDALLKRGWTKGSPAGFDRVRAICPQDFLKFIEATQTKLVNELKQQHGAAFEAGVIDALSKHLDSQGSLDAPRRGIKFYGKKLQCAYFKPSHGMNYDVLAQYAQNRLVVTRQVHFAPENHPDEAQSVDLMLSVNGIPVATAELKNHLTGQDVGNAVKQYKARDHRHKLFNCGSSRNGPREKLPNPEIKLRGPAASLAATVGSVQRALTPQVVAASNQGRSLTARDPSSQRVNSLWRLVVRHRAVTARRM